MWIKRGSLVRRPAWLFALIVLTSVLVQVTGPAGPALALDPLTPVPPPSPVAPPNAIQPVTTPGPTSISGSLAKDTVWGPQGSPYVITSNFIVPRGTALTLLPGTIVKLQAAALIVEGQILALGTPDRRVVFTSLRDDSVLGDTNGDGSATSPAPGDWSRVELTGLSNASTGVFPAHVIDYADFRYGGTAGYPACRAGQIYIQRDLVQATVSNSLFSHSGDAHVFANGGQRSHFGLYSNTFSRGSGSNCGVRLWQSDVAMVANTLADVWLSVEGGTRQRIWRNHLGGGTYLWSGSYQQPVPRSVIDVRYNTILVSASDYGIVDWTSNWWGYNINGELPICMTQADADAHYPQVKLGGDPNGECTGQPGYRTYGYRLNVAPGLSGAPAISPPIAVREAMAPRFGPVNLYSGALTYQVTDFEVEDAGKRLSAVRTFRSDKLLGGDAGPGWTSSYVEGLSTDGAGGSVLGLADGGSLPFANDVAAGYTPAPGIFADYTTGASGSSITTGDDTTYQFNPSGELIALLLGDPGHEVDIDRVAGKVSRVTGVSGRYIAFTRSGANLTGVADSTGRGIALTYTDGRLAVVSGVDGKNTRYEYDTSGHLTRVISPRNVVLLEASFGADGKVAWLELAGSGRTTFTYDLANSKTTAALANGDTVVYQYDSLGRLLSETRGGSGVHTVYDGDGRATAVVRGVPVQPMSGYSAAAALDFYDTRNDDTMSIEPSGRWEETTYNSKHRPLTTVRTDGSTVVRTYDANSRLNTLTDPLGKIWQYQFNSRGQVTRQTDPLNRVRTVSYLAAGDVETITDETGAVTTFGYDSLGRRTTVTDPLGHQRSYAYTTWDAMASVTLPRGGLTTIAYDDDRHQTSVTDATNHITGFEYDTQGRPSAQVNPDGGRITVEYDQIGRLLKRYNPRGLFIQRAYTPEGWLLSETGAGGAVTTYAYDPAGHQYRSTDALNRTYQVVYDAAGRPREVWNPDGGHGLVAYDAMGLRSQVTTPLGYVWKTEYDAAGRPVKWTDPLTYTTFAAYDDAGRVRSTTDQKDVVTSYAYDDTLRTITASDSLGQIGVERHNAAGLISASTDGSGVTTTYAYDNDDNLAGITDPAGTWAYEHDLAGRMTAEIDPLSHRTTAGYDGLGRVTSLSYPDSTNESFDYDLNGNLIEHVDRVGAHWTAIFNALDLPTSATDPLGGATTYAYDAIGQQTSVTDASGVVSHAAYDPMGRVAVTWDALGGSFVTSYDVDGRVVQQTDPSGSGSSFLYNSRGEMTQRRWGTTNPVSRYYSYDKVGRLVTAQDPYTTNFEYDIRGRLTGRSNVYGQKTTFGYDLAGRPTRRTTPSGKSTTWTYDSAGRLKDATDPLANKTQYTWDAAGSLKTVTLPRGGLYQYGYNTVRRLTSETNPLNATTSFTYDGEGRLTQTSYPSGRTIVAGYDLVGRQRTLTAGTDVRNFGYDAAGRMTSAGSGLSFAYDNRGLMTRSTDGFGDTTYEYDYTARLTKVTPPSGPVTTYTYDTSRGMLATVRGATNLNFSYNAAGQLTDESAVSPTVSYTSRGYDQAGRLNSLRSVAYNAIIGYTADSQVDTVCKTSSYCFGSNNLTDYNYDDAGRLTSATVTESGSTLSSAVYTWDGDGNRASVASNGASPVTAEFDLADRLSSTSDGTTYTYDDDGRMLTRGVSSFTYNNFGELTSAGPVSYSRDALGRVASRTQNSAVQSLSYDGFHGELAAARTDAGPITTLVRRPGGELLAQATAGSVTQRPSFNAHVDVVAFYSDVSRSQADISWKTTLDPFGVASGTTGSSPVPLAFQGDYTDQTSGLVDLGARHYEPATGRFATPDTIVGDLGAPVSFNRYAYGHADPINHFDPDGHWPDWLDDAIDTVGDWLSDWSDDFFGGLSSPGDATTSDDSVARFIGGVAEGVGDLVVGATQTAAAVTTCAKHSGPTCDALADVFTEQGLNRAWHATIDPIVNCFQTGEASTCGRATISIAELFLGSKGAAKAISAFAPSRLPLRIDDILAPEGNRMYSAGTNPFTGRPSGLQNNRSLGQQKIEVEAAARRGVTPVILGKGAGMMRLREAINGAKDFKWGVTTDGELKVIPMYAGGGPGEWPRLELAHTVLAGAGGRLQAAGSGTFYEGFPVSINRWSGHFEPPAETLTIGEAAFDRAGIDFISSVELS